MLSRPSSTLPVFEEQVLVVAGEGWDSNLECCTCRARSDESRQRKKQIWNTGRALCCCSEDKLFGPAANVACSSQQLLGPEETISRADSPVEGRWRGALEDKSKGVEGIK